MKKKIYLLLAIYGLLEVLAWGGLKYIETKYSIEYNPMDHLSSKHTEILERWLLQKHGYYQHDPLLGWSIRANGISENYRANAAGFRADTTIPLGNTKNKLRIACFGDSFTHGDEVKNTETWQSVIEQENPRIEMLNFGVSGYAIDQSYLRYLETGSKYSPDIVLIGFMSKDIFEPVNQFRPFQLRSTGMPFAKPRFMLNETGALVLLPNPFPKLKNYEELLEGPKNRLADLGRNDFYYERGDHSSLLDFLPTIRLVKTIKAEYDKRILHYGLIENGVYAEQSKAFKLSTKILQAFVDEVEKAGSVAYVVFLPNKNDILNKRLGEPPSYAPLKHALQAIGISCIDTLKGFSREPIQDLINGHYTASGNQQVGKYILNQLESKHVNKLDTSPITGSSFESSNNVLN